MTAAQLTPILLLLASNVFMTFAWYGHLKYTASPLWIAVLASWGIALFEYCLAVPANRWGSAVYSTAELKTMQEVITLCVFARLLGVVFGRADDYQSRHRLCAHLRGRILCVQGADQVGDGANGGHA